MFSIEVHERREAPPPYLYIQTKRSCYPDMRCDNGNNETT